MEEPGAAHMTELTTREKLILAGMEEVRAYGMRGFSLRRVATACGVSCAAPYKHFRDKQGLIIAMVEYVNDKWSERLKELPKISGSVENSIAEICAQFIRFMADTPQYRSVLLIAETGIDTPAGYRQFSISVPMKRLFVIYGRKHGLDREELRQRVFIVRSLVYGSSIMLGADKSLLDFRLERVRAELAAILNERA